MTFSTGSYARKNRAPNTTAEQHPYSSPTGGVLRHEAHRAAISVELCTAPRETEPTIPMTRDDAWSLVCEWTQSDALRRHMLGVEAAMRWYARKLGEDEEKWAITGLLHDFDYEKHPNAPDHPLKGAEVLRAKGWPDEIVRAILGHAHWGGVARDTPLARALFAVDELVGFVFACAYVQPSKRVADVKPASVKKKLKDKGFARTVSREDIELGIAEMGIPAEEHIANVIAALTEAAPALGLAGQAAEPPAAG
jgi:putative nucleotidyltransferase with HDIG domain